MREATDAELVALARAGDPEAFSRLVARCRGMAQRLAGNMISDGETAEELVQEAILEAYLSLDQVRQPERFRSWFFGIVLNLCRGNIRRRRRNAPIDRVTGGDAYELLRLQSVPPNPDQIFDERELHRLVLSAVGDLPPILREATLLFYYERLSVREIAALCGISVNAVKVRLFRARSGLRKGLLQRNIDQFVPTEPRRLKMVKVQIADVIKQDQHTIVLLVDDARQSILPIWIGDYEGNSIVMGVRGVSTPRPMTHNFIASLLETLEAELLEVRVESLQNETFYGVAKVRQGNRVKEIDARPSDVLALAVRTGSPIYVSEAVMAKAGKALQEGIAMPADLHHAEALPLPDGAGMDAILKELQEMIQSMRKFTGKQEE